MHFDVWVTPTLIALVGAIFCLIAQWRRRDWMGIAAFVFLGAFLLLRLWGHHANLQSWASGAFALTGAVWFVRKT